jgi:hypothetical protein
VDAIDGTFSARSLGSDFYASTIADGTSFALSSLGADLDVDGNVEGSVTISDFDPNYPDWTLHIGGSLTGSMELGQEGY